MAIVNFLFGNRVASGFSIQGAASFDAQLTIDELHERTSTVTEHPIEDGSTISDHVIVNPERVRLTGFVTDAGTRDPERGATQAAFDSLDRASTEGQIVQVITGRKTYNDMILVSADLPRERPDSMQFSLEFMQLRLVTPEVVEGVLSADQVDQGDADTLQPEIDEGQSRTSSTEDAEAEQVERRSTFLNSLLFGDNG